MSTIRDVAKLAGVSIATVSRVLNGQTNVTAGTREHILEAASSLRYTPSSAARSLITKRTQTIGLVLPDLYGEYFSELIRGVDLTARARNFHLLLSSSHSDPLQANAAIEAMKGRVDGLLVLWPNLETSVLNDSLLNMPMPVVLLNAPPRSSKVTTLATDNRGGAFLMTRHLIALGHRHLVMITGPVNNYEAVERVRGCSDAVRECAAEEIKLDMIEGDFSEASGWHAAEDILKMFPRPTAIFACNDMMAIGCMSGLREAGIKVPTEMSVAGFDDIPVARYLSPTLTTVSARTADMGTMALQTLLGLIERKSEDSGAQQILPLELRCRESTAPPLPGGAGG